MKKIICLSVALLLFLIVLPQSSKGQSTPLTFNFIVENWLSYPTFYIPEPRGEEFGILYTDVFPDMKTFSYYASNWNGTSFDEASPLTVEDRIQIRIDEAVAKAPALMKASMDKRVDKWWEVTEEVYFKVIYNGEERRCVVGCTVAQPGQYITGQYINFEWNYQPYPPDINDYVEPNISSFNVEAYQDAITNSWNFSNWGTIANLEWKEEPSGDVIAKIDFPGERASELWYEYSDYSSDWNSEATISKYEALEIEYEEKQTEAIIIRSQRSQERIDAIKDIYKWSIGQDYVYFYDTQESKSCTLGEATILPSKKVIFELIIND